MKLTVQAERIAVENQRGEWEFIPVPQEGIVVRPLPDRIHSNPWLTVELAWNPRTRQFVVPCALRGHND